MRLAASGDRQQDAGPEAMFRVDASGVFGTLSGKIKQLFLTTCINTIYMFPALSLPRARAPLLSSLCLWETELGNSISQLLAPSISFGA